MYHSSSQKRHWTFASEEQLARLRADANRKFKCRAVANGKVRSRRAGPAPTQAPAGTCGLSWSPRFACRRAGRERGARFWLEPVQTDAGPRLAVTGMTNSGEKATIKPWGMSSLCRTRTGHLSCRMSGQTILSSWHSRGAKDGPADTAAGAESWSLWAKLYLCYRDWRTCKRKPKVETHAETEGRLSKTWNGEMTRWVCFP